MDTMSAPSPQQKRRAPLFPVRAVVLGAFLPTFLFEIGMGAMLPVIAVKATSRGASLTTAGFMVALVAIGKILADLPAGALAARLGDRRAMMSAAVLAGLAFASIALTSNLWALACGVFVLGASSAVFLLARQAYLTEITPPLRRARVLSTLAGVHRIGLFVGPFAGAGIITVFSLDGVTWLGVATTALVLLVLVLVRDAPSIAGTGEGSATAGAEGPRPTLGQVARRHRELFLRLGVAILLVSAVRGARQTVLPLWGEFQGFEPEVTSVIFGVSGALDMLLFYPAGKIMDRFGRLWIGVPSMLTMAIALTMLPFAHTVGSVMLVAAVLGVGNGMGSGIIMTLGADVAPADARPAFLGIWRLIQDTGDALGPLVISAGIVVGSLAAGIWATAGLGAGSAAALVRWAPRYSDLANLRRRGRARPDRALTRDG